jgi:nucleotide-binding universal stress UspA family protein
MPSSARRPTIVVGYDGSEISRAAVTFAARRAGRHGRVYVVHAYDLPPDFLGAPNYDSLLVARQDHGLELLDALPLVDYERELIGGPPAQAIADVARVREADEIVVGARGLGRVRALLGSVSHELLHIADRPVVVIPAAVVDRQRHSADPPRGERHDQSAAPRRSSLLRGSASSCDHDIRPAGGDRAVRVLTALFAHRLSKPPEPPEWIVQDFLARYWITLMNGREGSGKSNAYQALIGAALTGQQWLGRDVNVNRILVVDEENPSGVVNQCSRFRLSLNSRSLGNLSRTKRVLMSDGLQAVGQFPCTCG